MDSTTVLWNQVNWQMDLITCQLYKFSCTYNSFHKWIFFEAQITIQIDHKHLINCEMSISFSHLHISTPKCNVRFITFSRNSALLIHSERLQKRMSLSWDTKIQIKSLHKNADFDAWNAHFTGDFSFASIIKNFWKPLSQKNHTKTPNIITPSHDICKASLYSFFYLHAPPLPFLVSLTTASVSQGC